jgi:hypothetical protein
MYGTRASGGYSIGTIKFLYHEISNSSSNYQGYKESRGTRARPYERGRKT